MIVVSVNLLLTLRRYHTCELCFLRTLSKPLRAHMRLKEIVTNPLVYCTYYNKYYYIVSRDFLLFSASCVICAGDQPRSMIGRRSKVPFISGLRIRHLVGTAGLEPATPSL